MRREAAMALVGSSSPGSDELAAKSQELILMLLRHSAEPFTREVPDDAQAWRILYTTTGVDGLVRVASGLVVVPTGCDGRPGPAFDWEHGTTGCAQHSAPTSP